MSVFFLVQDSAYPAQVGRHLFDVARDLLFNFSRLLWRLIDFSATPQMENFPDYLNLICELSSIQRKELGREMKNNYFDWIGP